jgi:AraC family transcriptional regulator
MNPAQKALWYIESHLAEPLSLDDVAGVAGVSRFHLVRAFAAATGFSVMRYVRARRLTRAAQALAAGAPDILSLALEADYSSHEAFTRAFREHFGVTPETVRAATCLDRLKLQEPIVMVSTLLDHLKAPRFETSRPLLIAGIEVADFSDLPREFARVRIPEARYAVFTHAEHISTIRRTVNTIWNAWLPISGMKAADAPNFERYDEKFDPSTGNGGLEIWIPVRE